MSNKNKQQTRGQIRREILGPARGVADQLDMKFRVRCHIFFGLVALLQFGCLAGGKRLEEDQVLMLQTKVENLIEKILLVIQDYYHQIRTELKCIPDEVPETIIDTLKKSIDCVDQNERNYDSGQITPNKHKKAFLKCFSDAKAEVEETITSINPYWDYCPENMTEKTYQINLTTTFTKTFHINIKNGLEMMKKEVQMGNEKHVCVFNQGKMVSDRGNRTSEDHSFKDNAMAEDQNYAEGKGKGHHSEGHHGKGHGSEEPKEPEEILGSANPENTQAHNDSSRGDDFAGDADQDGGDYNHKGSEQGVNESTTHEGIMHASKEHDDSYYSDDNSNGEGFDDELDQDIGDSFNSIGDDHHEKEPHFAQDGAKEPQAGKNTAEPDLKGHHDKGIATEQKPQSNEASADYEYSYDYDGVDDYDYSNDDGGQSFTQEERPNIASSNADHVLHSNDTQNNTKDKTELSIAGPLIDDDDDTSHDSGTDGENIFFPGTTANPAVTTKPPLPPPSGRPSDSDYYADPEPESDDPNYGNEYYNAPDKEDNLTHSRGHPESQHHLQNPAALAQSRIQIKPRNQFKPKPKKNQSNRRHKINLPKRVLETAQPDAAPKHRPVNSLSQTLSPNDF